MRKVIVFLFAIMMLIISYSKVEVNNEIKEDKIINPEKETTYIKVSYNNKINKLDLEDYVIGVVACEMPANFNNEALKAMAVAARTFALYKITTNKNYVLKSTTQDQCYIDESKMKKKWSSNYDKYYNKIKKAVNDTKNEYLTYNDKIIISFYFSISNGYTENCENVFSQKLDYLVSVDSSFDKTYNYKEKDLTISVSDFLSKLSIKDKSIKSIDIKKSKTNHISYIYINGIKFKGTTFRKKLSLRSTDVDIKYDKDNVYITSRGYGHGVGMSQYGANVMAKKGYKYDEILKYYYSGVKLMNN